MDSRRDDRPLSRDPLKSSVDPYAQTLEREAPPPVVPAKVAEKAPERAPDTPPEKTAETALETPAPRKRKSHRFGFAALAAILAVAAVVWFWKHSQRPLPPASGKIRLAVLPFENLTGDPKQEYVSDGVAEEMISQLGRLNHDQLAVIARTSVMSYKNTHKPVRQIAHELGINYVLEGSVRYGRDGFRIGTQLIHADDEAQVWAAEYDRPVGDLMKLEEEVARTVADEIQVQLLPRKPADVRIAPTVSRDAYVYYLQGRFAFNLRNAPNLFSAVTSFQQAIRQDPAFAAAYAGLADSYSMLMFYGYSPDDQTLPKARNAATKAIELDDALAEGHASLGYIYFLWDWNWQAAEREFQRAIDLNQNYAPAHHWYALFLTAVGRRDESLSQIQQARELDPISSIVGSAYAYVSYFAGQQDQAVSQCEAVIQQDPQFMVAHAVLGLAREAQFRYPESIAEFEKAIRLSATRPVAYLDYLGHAYAISGQRAKAEAILDELQTKAKSVQMNEVSMAATLVALGQQDRALTVMEKHFAKGILPLMWLKVDPRFDPLRPNPRFQALLQRAGFTP